MIGLTKAPKPDVLTKNEAQWTSTLLKKISAGIAPTDTEKSRYRHADIKLALVQETSGKCAYCESKLRHIAYGDVEHIHPKKKDPSLSFIWENLTLACDICNTNKGAAEDVVDPYSCDPTQRFYICGPLILAENEDAQAYVTQRTLDLNRAELVERRQRRIEHLQALLIVLAATQDDSAKQALKTDYLTNETRDSLEYAAISKWFFQVAQAEGRI